MGMVIEVWGALVVLVRMWGIGKGAIGKEYYYLFQFNCSNCTKRIY